MKNFIEVWAERIRILNISGPFEILCTATHAQCLFRKVSEHVHSVV